VKIVGERPIPMASWKMAVASSARPTLQKPSSTMVKV